MTALELTTGAPFDGPGVFRFLADHAIPGLEIGTSDSFSRLIRLPHSIAAVTYRLAGTPDAPAIACEMEPRSSSASSSSAARGPDLTALASHSRRLFDLDADSVAIDAALAADPALAVSVEGAPGIRLPGSVDTHETLFRTLVGQQISVSAARTVLARWCAELAEPGMFPTAAQIAAHPDTVRGPASRVRSIIGIAEALADGSLQIDERMPVPEFTARLLAMPGIGPWTAGYVSMRVLGASDVLLASDLIMLRGAQEAGLPSTAKALTAYATRWSPWRSYAGLHLWRLAGR